MNILICGLGSIGQRQARLIQKHFKHNLSALRTRKTGNTLGIPELISWDEVNNVKFDIAFITNPTNQHTQTAFECAQRGMHLFIEKPIDASNQNLDELIQLVKKKNLTAYVAYPLRFHPLIIKLKVWLTNKTILHAHFVCHSYLPNWRPGTNHLENYSAYKDQGGGVLLDISHELDLSHFLIGPVESISGTAGRMSQVTVDSEDYADLIIKHKNITSNIHLSYVGHIPQRKITVDTTEGSCHVDLMNNTFETKGDGLNIKESHAIDKDAMYLNQLNYFFDNLSNRDLENNLFEASHLFQQLLSFKQSL